MAGELHGADDVRKTHTHAHATFQSPNAGRLGVVTDGRVTLLRSRSPVRLPRLPERAALPVHARHRAPRRRSRRRVDRLLDPPPAGLVVAATGGGNTTPWLLAAGTRLIGLRRAGGADDAVSIRPGSAGIRVRRRQLAVVGGRRHLLRHAGPAQGARARGARPRSGPDGRRPRGRVRALRGWSLRRPRESPRPCTRRRPRGGDRAATGAACAGGSRSG